MKKNEYIREKEVKKYKGKIIWKILAISIAFIVVGSCLVLYTSMNGLNLDNEGDTGSIMSIKTLSPPIVSASEGTDGTIFLEEEAGISAYTT